MANGIDNREVVSSSYNDLMRKSISEEITFESDIDEKRIREKIIFQLVDNITRKMREEFILGKTITVKIRLEGFKTYTRSKTLTFPVNDSETILNNSIELFNNFNNKNKKYRLIGINVSNFIKEKEYNPGLFDNFNIKKLKVDQTLDKIKKKYGNKSINRAIYFDKNN